MLVARHPFAFKSRCGTDTAGRGAFEPHPEDGARTKLFDREFQFRESHTEAESIKTPDRIRKKNNDHISIYKGSAWAPAFAGTHAPSRAGQHFDLFDSIFDRE